MRHSTTWAIAAALLPAILIAAPAPPKADGIGTKDYHWAKMEGEFSAALAADGNSKMGQALYDACVECHLPSGAGHPGGSYPQLAGQHSTVLIKQMADIRRGLRDNPKMLPYAREISDAQGLADVAAHIQTLCIPTSHGKYEGADAAQQIASGKALYEQQCTTCHGTQGEGNASKYYPVIAGQHYKYLLRQLTEVRDGKRRNANPEMAALVKAYTDSQLMAISAYQASLTVKGAMCMPRMGRGSTTAK
jgi:cytochrome c553